MASHNPWYPSIAPEVEEEAEDLFSRLEEEEGQQEQQSTHLWQQPDLQQPPQQGYGGRTAHWQVPPPPNYAWQAYTQPPHRQQ